MKKIQIRKKIIEKRDSVKRRSDKEKKINENLMTLNFSDEDIISGYFPFRNEVCIIHFLKFLTKKGITVCLPSIQKKNFHLLFKKWKPEDTMVNGKFDIMEPSNNKYIEPNILIVPLVAFDPKKNRLGYGGGFYDRTIAYLEKLKKISTIGVAFEEQKINNIPLEKFDRSLDLVITQAGIIK